MYASAFIANLNARDGMRARWAEVSTLNMPDTLCEEPSPDGEVPQTETVACVIVGVSIHIERWKLTCFLSCDTDNSPRRRGLPWRLRRARSTCFQSAWTLISNFRVLWTPLSRRWS